MKRMQFDKIFFGFSILIMFVTFVVVITTLDSHKGFDILPLYAVILLGSIMASIILLYLKKARKLAMGILLFWIILFACQAYVKSQTMCHWK